MPDGQLDPSFSLRAENLLLSSGPPDVHQHLALPDGKVLAEIAVAGRFSFARFNIDGTFDASFQVQTSVRKMFLQPDGRVLVLDLNLFRLDSTGAVDQTFTPSPAASLVTDVLPLKDGRIIFVIGTAEGLKVRRLLADGTSDTTFAEQLIQSCGIHAMVEHPNRKVSILFAIGGQPHVYRFLPTGEIETNFPLPSWQLPFCSLSLPAFALDDDQFLLPSATASVPGVFSRIGPSGDAVDAFAVHLEAPVEPSGAVSLGNGQALIFGGFTRANGQSCHHLVRINSDGQVDPGFLPVTLTNARFVFSVAVQPDGKLLLLAQYLDASSYSRRLLRLNSDGSRDVQFSLPPEWQSVIRSFYLQPDGKILLGGAFTNGLQQFQLVRVHPDGSPDLIFPALPHEVSWVGQGHNGDALVVLADNHLRRVRSDGEIQSWAAEIAIDDGAYPLANGSTLLDVRPMPGSRQGVALLDATGTLEAYYPQSYLAPGIYISLDSITPLPDQRLLIDGTVTAYATGFADTRGLILLGKDGHVERTYPIGDLQGPGFDVLCALTNKHILITLYTNTPSGTFPVLRKFHLTDSPPPPPRLLPPVKQVDGTFQPSVQTEVWTNIAIEASTDLSRWTQLYQLSVTNRFAAPLSNYLFFRAFRN